MKQMKERKPQKSGIARAVIAVCLVVALFACTTRIVEKQTVTANAAELESVIKLNVYNGFTESVEISLKNRQLETVGNWAISIVDETLAANGVSLSTAEHSEAKKKIIELVTGSIDAGDIEFNDDGELTSLAKSYVANAVSGAVATTTDVAGIKVTLDANSVSYERIVKMQNAIARLQDGNSTIVTSVNAMNAVLRQVDGVDSTILDGAWIDSESITNKLDARYTQILAEGVNSLDKLTKGGADTDLVDLEYLSGLPSGDLQVTSILAEAINSLNSEQQTILQCLQNATNDVSVLMQQYGGADGSNGANGANGANGSAGVNGSNGKDGSGGSSGSNGSAGSDGSNGSNGVNGSNGSNGSGGVNGSNGANGSSGSNGSNGANGSSGSNGSNGTNGVNGSAGANGTNGSSGSSGSNGSSGANGTNGANGSNGSSGANGANGANGVNGSNGKDGANADLTEVWSAISTLKESLNTVNTTLESAKSELSSAIGATKDELSNESDSDKNELSGSIDDIKTDLANNIDKANTDLESAKSELSDNLESTKNELSSTLESTKNELSGTLNSTKNELVSELQDKKADSDTKIANLTDTLESAKKELSSTLESTKSELSANLDSVKSELGDNLESAKSELSGNLESTKNELSNTLESTRDALINELQEKKADSDEKIAELVDNLELAKNELSDNLESAKNELSDNLDFTKNELNDKLDSTRNELTSELEEKKADSDTKIANLVGTLEEFSEETAQNFMNVNNAIQQVTSDMNALGNTLNTKIDGVKSTLTKSLQDMGVELSENIANNTAAIGMLQELTSQYMADADGRLKIATIYNVDILASGNGVAWKSDGSGKASAVITNSKLIGADTIQVNYASQYNLDPVYSIDSTNGRLTITISSGCVQPVKINSLLIYYYGKDSTLEGSSGLSVTDMSYEEDDDLSDSSDTPTQSDSSDVPDVGSDDNRTSEEVDPIPSVDER